jgi:hypothetical protein
VQLQGLAVRGHRPDAGGVSRVGLDEQDVGRLVLGVVGAGVERVDRVGAHAVQQPPPVDHLPLRVRDNAVDIRKHDEALPVEADPLGVQTDQGGTGGQQPGQGGGAGDEHRPVGQVPPHAGAQGSGEDRAGGGHGAGAVQGHTRAGQVEQANPSAMPVHCDRGRDRGWDGQHTGQRRGAGVHAEQAAAGGVHHGQRRRDRGGSRPEGHRDREREAGAAAPLQAQQPGDRGDGGGQAEADPSP